MAWPGYAASLWAFVFAAISFYWAAGGTIGLSTLGATIQDLALARDPLVVILGGWAIGLAKVIGGLLPLSLIHGWRTAIPRWIQLGLAWAAGIGMILYGGASFVQHLLMVSGIIHLPRGLGWTGAFWHLVLWDPWWSLGGVLFVAVAWSTTRNHAPA